MKSEMKWEPFPTKALPSPLREYVVEGAGALKCDPSYIALPLLVTAGSAIGNSRRIRLTPTRSQPSVLWGAIVGDSGAGKSEPLGLATKPAWRRWRKLHIEYKAEMAEYKRELAEWKRQKKDDRGDEPDEPEACQHPVCDDVTVEAIGERLEVTPHGTLVAPDELAAWFGGFNQYKGKKGGADIPNWLRMYDASVLKTDRKGGDKTTIFVAHAAVCVTGGIQPETLRRCLTSDLLENGLAARIMLTMPPRHKPVWSEADISHETRNAVDDLFDRLYGLRLDDGPDGPEPKMIDLADDAKIEYVERFNRHVGEIENLRGPELAAWMKGIGLPGRFALIDHCVRGMDGLIPLQSVRNGIILADWFTRETLRVYGMLGAENQDDPLADLLKLIRDKGGRMTVRRLRQLRRNYRDNPRLAETDLQILVDEGRGHWENPAPSRVGGHPAKMFVLDDYGDNDNDTAGFDSARGGNVDVDGVDASSSGQSERRGRWRP